MLLQEIHPYIRYARYLHLDKTASYEPHTPLDARLFYVLDGSGCISACGNRYTLSKGNVLMINSGVKYHLVTPENSISYLAVNFDYTFSNSSLSTPVPPKTEAFFRPEQIIENIHFEDIAELNELVLIKDMFEIEQKLIHIEYEYSHRFIYSDLKISNLLSEILIEIARKIKLQPLSGETSRPGKTNPRIIIDFIHENYNKPLTNADIGLAFGYHPNYVSELVKLYTGMPLHQYLLHIRLAHATDYLDTGTLNVNEIAKECGFGSIYYFSRYFKKFMGMSPTEYRHN